MTPMPKAARAGVGHGLAHAARLVQGVAVGRHGLAQRGGVGTRRAGGRQRLRQQRQQRLRGAHRRGLVVDHHVDHAIGRHHRQRADVVGLDAAEAAAFDHGRPAQADAGAAHRDDDVAATQQRGVAREAAAGHDADARHHARQRGEAGEGARVQAGHAAPVDVARAAAAAFAEPDHRQAPACGHVEQPVALGVVVDALRAGEHGVVVGQHRHRPPLHGAGAADQAVGRRVALQVVQAAAAALSRHGEPTVLGEAAVVQQVCDVRAGAAQAAGVAARHGLGSCRIVQPGPAVQQALQVGAQAAGGFGHGRGGARGSGCIGQAPQPDQRLAFLDGLAHRRVDRQHQRRPRGQQRPLHLHRLQQQQHRSGGDGLPGLDFHGDDAALHRGGELRFGGNGRVHGRSGGCA
jgi:hypothetical protein